MTTYIWGDTIDEYKKLPGTIAQHGNIIDGYGRELSRMRQEISTIRPVPKVAEYNLLASEVSGPCNYSEPCEVKFRLRRTPKGISCSAPLTVYKIRNHFGLEYPVTVNDFQVIKVGEDWLNIAFSFNVPKAVQEGLSEFFIELEYEGCEFSELTVKENTPNLRFQVNEIHSD